MNDVLSAPGRFVRESDVHMDSPKPPDNKPSPGFVPGYKRTLFRGYVFMFVPGYIPPAYPVCTWGKSFFFLHRGSEFLNSVTSSVIISIVLFY